MYPNLYFLFKDLFGLDIAWLRFINSFGFMVAVSFIFGVIATRSELLFRKSLFKPTIAKIWIGKKASTQELLVNGIVGFIFGFKIIGIFFSHSSNSQDYIMSAEGSWAGGLILAFVFAFLVWWNKKKNALPTPIQKEIEIYPHDRIGDMLIIGVVMGFLGSKIFDNLEHWDKLIEHPIEELFAFSGLTFYGGLIFASISLGYYAYKHKIRVIPFLDSITVATMLSYGIGRIGCHLAGDGDWGIPNTKPNPFSWLPDWMWSYSYPNNVLGEVLPVPVYPTPLYEAIICILLAFVLLYISRKTKVIGLMVGVYFILNGIERFFIELIRVNIKYHVGNLAFTQAEFLSLVFILFGTFVVVRQTKLYYKNKTMTT